MEDLAAQAGQRDIVNNYVWDGDGGLRTETQAFTSTIQQTIGGSFSFQAATGVETVAAVPGLRFELSAMANMHMTGMMTKTEARIPASPST